MSRIFFASELEGVATFWRIERRDGCVLGFTSHDRNLWFDGVLHRAAPGLVPSAIRRTAGIDSDSAEVEGALAHDAIRAVDLAAGRYDGARFAIGVVDWETLDWAVLYHGEAGAIAEDAGGFSASDVVSIKEERPSKQNGDSMAPPVHEGTRRCVPFPYARRLGNPGYAVPLWPGWHIAR